LSAFEADASSKSKGMAHFALIRLAHTFGSPNIAAAPDVCHAPREVSGLHTCGFPLQNPENSKNAHRSHGGLSRARLTLRAQMGYDGRIKSPISARRFIPCHE